MAKRNHARAAGPYADGCLPRHLAALDSCGDHRHPPDIARNQGSELLVHDRQERIKQCDSYAVTRFRCGAEGQQRKTRGKER